MDIDIDTEEMKKAVIANPTSDVVEDMLNELDRLYAIANDMRSEAEALEHDTLVSMAEGVCNERIAAELKSWADKMEKGNGNS
jgi:hypothetical protein